MTKVKIDDQTNQKPSPYKIVVAARGPFLVYGQPPLNDQYIMPNQKNESWYFQQGQQYPTQDQPTMLCRCGHSHIKPYCDGTHATAKWDSRLTAPLKYNPEDMEVVIGNQTSMIDNTHLCVFARFCHGNGGVWNMIQQAETPQEREKAITEASMCPSGRLTAIDNATKKSYEFNFKPSLALIQDPIISSSGGLWVRGNIAIENEQGEQYATHNRAVLCRCGLSSNKPHCDGTHASAHWSDHLYSEPLGETLPEEVV